MWGNALPPCPSMHLCPETAPETCLEAGDPGAAATSETYKRQCVQNRQKMSREWKKTANTAQLTETV